MKAFRHILAVMAILSVFSSGYAIQVRRVPGSIYYDAPPASHDNPVLWTAGPVPMTKAALPGAYATKDALRTGTPECLVVLADFNDRHFTTQDTLELRNYYHRFFNESGFTPNYPSFYKGYPIGPATGCVADYFRDQSYGKYAPTYNIVGPIHASKGYSYYGKNDAGTRKLVRELCDSLVAHNMDLTKYSNNGNIDQFIFIYAGKGENYDGADVNNIFPQSDTIRNYNGYKYITYACSCELFWDSDTIIDGIANICHEICHTLGLPDFYNTNYSDNISTQSMGYWSLMDYGNYENQGFTPVGLTAFEKYSLGWLELEEILSPGYYALADINQEQNPDAGIHTAYRINTPQEDSFVVLENHLQTGWYKYHAAQGLMVTVVRYDRNCWTGKSINTSTDVTQKRYHLLPADNNYNQNTNQGDLFPYQNVDSITTKGQPALMVYRSQPQYSVYNIRKEGTTVSFFAGKDRESTVSHNSAQDISIDIQDGQLLVAAPTGTPLTVHDISGKTILETLTTEPDQHINLPGRGIWIIKCGNKTRKITFGE